METVSGKHEDDDCNEYQYDDNNGGGNDIMYYMKQEFLKWHRRFDDLESKIDDIHAVHKFIKDDTNLKQRIMDISYLPLVNKDDDMYNGGGGDDGNSDINPIMIQPYNNNKIYKNTMYEENDHRDKEYYINNGHLCCITCLNIFLWSLCSCCCSSFTYTITRIDD